MAYWRRGVRHTEFGGYTVANLPTVATAPYLAAGDTAYATNGLKTGETTGNGTGCPVYRSADNTWRRYDTSAVVTA